MALSLNPFAPVKSIPLGFKSVSIPRAKIAGGDNKFNSSGWNSIASRMAETQSMASISTTTTTTTATTTSVSIPITVASSRTITRKGSSDGKAAGTTGLGRHAPRSKTGCSTCLSRKVKCDETRPRCNRCAALGRECLWITRIRKQREPSAAKKKKQLPEGCQGFRPLKPKISALTSDSDKVSTSGAGPNISASLCGSPDSSMLLDPLPRGSSYVSPLTGPLVPCQGGIAVTPDYDDCVDEEILSPASSYFSSSSFTSCPNESVNRTQLANPDVALMCMRRSSPSLSPTLSTSHIPLANSLVVTPADWEFLRYYPSTAMVHEYRKPWEWCKLSYINQEIVPKDPIIMRMMLAISASELCRLQNSENTVFVNRKGSMKLSLGTVHDVGLMHYTLAVQDLSRLLSEEMIGGLSPCINAKEKMERLLPALFFMIEYEIRFGYSRSHLKLHLEGVRSLFDAYEKALLDEDKATHEAAGYQGLIRKPDSDENSLALFTRQLLLWIAYLEVIGGQGLFSQSLLTRMYKPRHPKLQIDHLYTSSRFASQQVWGDRYPESAIIDDIENHAPLHMLHDNNLVRSRIWQLAKAISEEKEKDVDDTKEGIWEELERIAQVSLPPRTAIQFASSNLPQQYQDVLQTALAPPEKETRRVFYTMRCAASSYFAQVLFHKRMLDPHSPPTTPHISAVTNVIRIAKTDYPRGTRYLSLHLWGMLMTGIEMDDPVFSDLDADRQWIVDRLAEVKGLHSESPWASKALEEAIRQRRGREVDLLKLFSL